jgi:hypothetical protein
MLRTAQIECRELSKLHNLIKSRAQLTRDQITASISVQMVRLEKQMAAVYDAQDARWTNVYHGMNTTCERMNRKLVKRCNAVGIPAKFRPQFITWWHYRGEHYNKARRAELRNVAQEVLEARRRAAIEAINRSVAELLSELKLGRLSTKEAKVSLRRRIPTVEQLMPQLKLEEIEKKLRMPSE